MWLSAHSFYTKISSSTWVIHMSYVNGWLQLRKIRMERQVEEKVKTRWSNMWAPFEVPFWSGLNDQKRSSSFDFYIHALYMLYSWSWPVSFDFHQERTSWRGKLSKRFVTTRARCDSGGPEKVQRRGFDVEGENMENMKDQQDDSGISHSSRLVIDDRLIQNPN